MAIFWDTCSAPKKATSMGMSLCLKFASRPHFCISFIQARETISSTIWYLILYSIANMIRKYSALCLDVYAYFMTLYIHISKDTTKMINLQKPTEFEDNFAPPLPLFPKVSPCGWRFWKFPPAAQLQVPRASRPWIHRGAKGDVQVQYLNRRAPVGGQTYSFQNRI